MEFGIGEENINWINYFKDTKEKEIVSGTDKRKYKKNTFKNNFLLTPLETLYLS
jgi:hypothetical protein